MPVNWRWRFVVALVGIALFWGHSGVAAKIERFKDNEGTLHISNTGEAPDKPGGATTPNLPSAPTAQPMPPGPRPVPIPPPPEPVAPPPSVDPGAAPPVMEPEPNQQQFEPPAEQPVSQAGNDQAGRRAQAEPDAGLGHPETAQPPVREIPVPRGRGRGDLGR